MISPRLRQIQRFAKLREHPHPHWSMLGKPHKAANTLNTDAGGRGEGVSVHVSFAKRCLGNGSQPREVPLVDKDRKKIGPMYRRHAKQTGVYLGT